MEVRREREREERRKSKMEEKSDNGREEGEGRVRQGRERGTELNSHPRCNNNCSWWNEKKK